MNAPAPTERPRRSWSMTRKALVWLSIPLLILVSIAGCLSVMRYKDERARASWKTATLNQLAGLSITNEEIGKELAALKASPPRDGNRDWVSENVLVMTNGEFLIYGFWHGSNSGFPNHLFLAHSSKGQWLYSTYHFCNSMVGVRFEDPPGSLAEFEERYSARVFDGKSDECLQKTWPLNN